MITRLSPPDWRAALAVTGKVVGTSQSEHAHNTLFQAIVQGRVGPACHLAEQPIADTIGVSRISVRDAIRQLESAGLVSIYPHRGAFTVSFTPQDIEEIFSLRAALESLAIRLVAQAAKRTDIARLEDVIDEMAAVEARGDRYAGAQADAKFHGILMEVSGHGRAFASWKRMSAQITMAVYSAASYYDAIGNLAGRHVTIIEGLKSGDADRCERLIVEHIISGSHLLLEAVGRQKLLEDRTRRREHAASEEDA
ncbi:MAG: GntR family transcriptional regulator [Trueperaceae bacterium]|nr:GntR family transcriptional regulator [Trueperaceae bacterium]MCC6309964.1 GntR family transcriptional regulator [Trueperaceae bacterium]MCO5173712.1 GntR family transcriptional regulator [Trueperaceae bacterium]MCW5820344.1 GntR family transcriptional regulator [Trueperaceae bacterium]